MNELKIKDKIYEMPSSWEECTLEKYVEFLDIKEKGLRRLINIISVLADCPKEILRKVKIEDLTKIDLSWMSEKVGSGVENIIEIEGVKYGLEKDLKAATIGTMGDLEHYAEDESKNIHKIVAILMRPIIKENGELYIIEDYDSSKMGERADIFRKKMNVKQLLNVRSFFLSSVSGFEKSMQSSFLS